MDLGILLSHVIILTLTVLHRIASASVAYCAPSANLTTTWRPEFFPNPQRDVTMCGLCRPSFICDPSRVFNMDEAMQLNNKLLDARTSTPCPCRNCSANSKGYTLSVAVVPEIGVTNSSHGGTAVTTHLQHFSRYLLRKSWSNMNRCGDLVVVVLSIKESKIHISIGSKVKENTRAECFEEVEKQATKQLKMGSYFKAIEDMISLYKVTLRLGKTCVIPGDEERSLRMLYIALGAIAGAVIGGLCIFSTCVCIINTTVLKDKGKTTRKRDDIQENDPAGDDESDGFDYGDKW